MNICALYEPNLLMVFLGPVSRNMTSACYEKLGLPSFLGGYTFHNFPENYCHKLSSAILVEWVISLTMYQHIILNV